ncbi:MAG: ABC transporter ATP-binding protein [Phycisphaerales bacterium]|nr:ABC transporter ATP-binding protein [Phycisphaerales bacterium]
MSLHSSNGNGRAEPDGREIIANLSGLTKTYYKPDGSVLVEALKGLDLEVQRGEYVAIMGSSGSGKSTLMNLLGALDRPTSGRYVLDGEDVAKLDDIGLSTIRGRKIGFVFQAFNLIPALTILENVEVPLFYQGIPPAERHRRSKDKLELVGLADRLHHRPSELSGGQQQRAAIARALVNEPAIIMADEPTGNLDSKTGETILDVLQNLHERGLTIFLVTHDDKVVSRCERIVRLRDGRLESDEVLRRSGILRDQQPATRSNEPTAVS